MKIAMIRYCFLVVAAWMTVMANSQPLSFGKMSPLVRQAAIDATMTSTRAAGMNNSRRLTAFVKIDKNAADSVLSHYGCRKLAQWGDIVIADIPLLHLRKLSAEPQVLRIEAGQYANALMDTTLIVVNALPVYESTPEHAAYRGEGVVVGLVDVGFDLTHPNFRDAETSESRISAFWDQLSPDTVGSVLPVGRDYVGRAEVLAHGRSIDGDTQWHGTHTLGTATGIGAGTPWRGLAPASDLCLVSNAVTADTSYIAKADLYKYTTATDALGFKYIFDYARLQGKPCVVSFSQGYFPYLDAEDSLFAAVLDSLSGPGRIIVASAGNESIEKTYFEKPAGMSEAGAFIQNKCLNSYYRILTDGPVYLSLYGYCDESTLPTDTFSVSLPDLPLDTLLTDTKVLSSGDTLKLKLYYEQSSFTQHNIFTFYISSSRQFDQLPPLALVASGDGSAEVYGSSTSAFASKKTDPRWQSARVGRNVLAPGCFPAVLCVGATTQRLSVCNTQGKELKAWPNSRKGLIAYFSSVGPSMNGLMKPDVVAPGEMVISSKNHFVNDSSDVVAYTYDLDGTPYPWSASLGTSMSTPAVAGAIALWLQACPTLTTDEVREVLSRTCRHPEPQLSYPNNTYGHGEIDVYRGLLDILGVTAFKAISPYHPEGVQVCPAEGGLKLTFTHASTEPVTLSVYDLGGACQYTTVLSMRSDSDLFVPLPQLASGVYVVQINGKNLQGSQLVRL